MDTLGQEGRKRENKSKMNERDSESERGSD